MACPPATARALKGLSRPSGRRCDRRSRGATTARDTDDASLHGEGQVREDSTRAGEADWAVAALGGGCSRYLFDLNGFRFASTSAT